MYKTVIKLLQNAFQGQYECLALELFCTCSTELPLNESLKALVLSSLFIAFVQYMTHNTLSINLLSADRL